MYFNIDGVDVISNIDDLTEEEARKYINYVKERTNYPLIAITVSSCPDGKIDIDFALWQKFECIRRITGEP